MNKMFKKQFKSSDTHSIEQYKIYRNKLTHLKELSKLKYFQSMFNKYNNNAKKTWQLIINIKTLKNNSKHNTPQNNRPNAKSNYEELNSFCSNVEKTLSAKISKPHIQTLLESDTFQRLYILAPTGANEIIISLDN